MQEKNKLKVKHYLNDVHIVNIPKQLKAKNPKANVKPNQEEARKRKLKRRLIFSTLGVVGALSVAAYMLITLATADPVVPDSSKEYARGGIFIPLYKYPNRSDPLVNEYYTKVGSLKVPTIVILNPSSGRDAFDPPTPNWVWAIEQLRNVLMICYLPSAYGQRPLEDIQNWVDAYLSNGWECDGFHIDEVSRNKDYGHYQAIRDYIKSKGENLIVSFNPGTLPNETIALTPDFVTIFEKKQSTETVDIPPYMTSENTKQWRAIARDIPKENALKEMQNMQNKLIYWKYVTDMEEYKYLPTYFDDLIQWLEEDSVLVN